MQPVWGELSMLESRKMLFRNCRCYSDSFCSPREALCSGDGAFPVLGVGTCLQMLGGNKGLGRWLRSLSVGKRQS